MSEEIIILVEFNYLEVASDDQLRLLELGMQETLMSPTRGYSSSYDVAIKGNSKFYRRLEDQLSRDSKVMYSAARASRMSCHLGEMHPW